MRKGNNTQTTTKRLQNKPQQVSKPVKGLAIGKDWRVGADSLNIILYRRQVNKKIGREYWRAHSYYATVTNVLAELVNQGIRDTELADLKTVCDKIDQIHKDIMTFSTLHFSYKKMP
tara:strand:- start:462 stop:812 length:351 start_codon:yes stop_codon:yes gene_type:complete